MQAKQGIAEIHRILRTTRRATDEVAAPVSHITDAVNTVACSVHAVAEEVRDRRDAALTRPVLALIVTPSPNHTACRAA